MLDEGSSNSTRFLRSWNLLLIMKSVEKCLRPCYPPGCGPVLDKFLCTIECHMTLYNSIYLLCHQKDGLLLIFSFRKKFCSSQCLFQPGFLSSSYATVTVFNHVNSCEFGYLNSAKPFKILYCFIRCS